MIKNTAINGVNALINYSFKESKENEIFQCRAIIQGGLSLFQPQNFCKFHLTTVKNDDFPEENVLKKRTEY